jgi:hypothetical protein
MSGERADDVCPPCPALTLKCSSPGRGPSTFPSGVLAIRLKIWRGLRYHKNCCISLMPWLPPLLGLTKTSRGYDSGRATMVKADGLLCSALAAWCNVRSLALASAFAWRLRRLARRRFS